MEIMFTNQFKNKQWKLCLLINSKINNGYYVQKIYNGNYVQ